MSEPPAELSCYTAGLVAYLEPRLPDIRDRLAAAVRLRVRTDPPDGGLAFSHHARVDIDGRGRGLVHRGADDWSAARGALDAELSRHGTVLAVGNTRHIPWSPSYGGAETAHWVVLRRHGDKWQVRDDFDALTPHGTQTAYEGLVDEAELQALLTPLSRTTAQAVSRDRHALGEAVEPAPYTGWRWLELSDTPDTPAPEGTWVDGLLPVLRLVADTVCADPDALARHADDIWTAARHQRFRLASRPGAAGVAETAAAWGSLPQAVRFGIASAERGRYREGVVRQAFEQLIATVERLESERREDTGR
ncbi:hypothetical protein [Streptomyces sp. DSM 15324]|uniref:hypothetical protein n=1 Tax=Streptomyces sp. DSM 15324 TaxID=1739111 RepID=UPI000749534F|nr:hypothetical protein [Streptomyces sp. DSM 15324]KUO06794.1 hypothetical protein AQJ58_39110 [Streptomyces sp. DSM 15324]